MANVAWKRRGEYVIVQNPVDHVTYEEYSRKPSSKAAGRRFLVIVLRKGDRYGLDDSLAWESDDPGIEVWDLTHANSKGFDERGQFVSRYYSHTIAESRRGVGIDLVGYEPAWKIDGTAWGSAIALAKSVTIGATEWRDERHRIGNREIERANGSSVRRGRKRRTSSRRTVDSCRSARTGRFTRCR